MTSSGVDPGLFKGSERERIKHANFVVFYALKLRSIYALISISKYLVGPDPLLVLP